MPNAVELHGLALGEVDETALARLLQLGNLRGDVGAAVDRHGLQALLVLGKLLELLGDLLSQLAGGRQHQRLHVVPLGVEMVEERQAEGRGLAGACLGQTNEIAVALQQQGNRLGLDVGGRLETHLGDSAGGRRAQGCPDVFHGS